MDAILADAPRWTGGKQRLTATQLWRMLRGEKIFVGATLVKSYVREYKRRRAEVFVPLVYKPGDLAEVDFFEVLVDLLGKRIKTWMFVLRMMASGRDFACLLPRQDQTCFLEGHVRAFEHLGAVPQRIVYDNLRPAVSKVLVGSERALTARFAALANHYLYEPCFARPATGHDKGGVEARGKGIRWQHLVPIPEGTNLSQMSETLLRRLDDDAALLHDASGRTTMERFLEEKPQMVPLAGTPFESAQMLPVSASGSALVKIGGGNYSVWSRWARLSLTAWVGVDRVAIVGPDARVEHQRVAFGSKAIDYRHYLPELSRKPQALRQVIEELLPKLGETYAKAWRQLVDEHGPKQAARHFAQVLKVVLERGEKDVSRTLELAMAQGEPVLLALRPKQVPVRLSFEHLPAALREVDVASASVSDFDALLGGVR
jgi:hypothetical protein